jgi:glycosyltransferase involved in cell wall biosynthesis
MRIAMVSPLEMRVPPVGYGGTELVVSLLTEGLVKAGHDVTLFASGDSVTAARLVSGSELFLRGTDRNKPILNMLNVLNAVERAGEFDLIHNHTTFEGLAMAGLVGTPMLTTLHGGIAGDWGLLFQHYTGWYNAISHSALSLLPAKARCAGVVYNAIDFSIYPFNPGPREDFLLYLSRISQEKGTHIAIEVAKRAGRRLKIAGNVDDVDVEYFEKMVLPEVDGVLIDYVGEANLDMKRDLMSRADCLLAPITWNEPFGLFMVEAMASGAPVIAFGLGSVPEVVDEGITGYVVSTVPEMVSSLDAISRIDRAVCRSTAKARFDVSRMVRDYVSAYERVFGKTEYRPSPPVSPVPIVA